MLKAADEGIDDRVLAKLEEPEPDGVVREALYNFVSWSPGGLDLPDPGPGKCDGRKVDDSVVELLGEFCAFASFALGDLCK